MEHFSMWLIEASNPWTFGKHGAIKTQFEFSNLRLLTLAKHWDNNNASDINKQ